ncbi:RNA polymerase sigma factor [Sphingobacterium corticibacterium]|uniref:RNA polymerase sigma-70 factor n=1 Tax=Sphingobacterium corticibacterium TaxID=2484746 RepID=A0A4Q6XDI2_9SPHI|nr:RNA polymerase sigma-70 factor [Sphingobacterium corticibacterium]RZF57479.1 RNA polymerase sigma-70 factor [Sphingobacterium corticibacterium]
MINDQNISEHDILLRLQSGDQDAFRVLYERYSRLIYGNIMRFIGDESVADDLLQDVFVKIWEHRASIDPNLSFSAYLFTCSRNTVFNFKRRLKLEIESAIHLAYDSTGFVESVDSILHKKEVQNLIENVISQLPLQRQRIFRMCKLDGKSYQEVAEELQISVSTVRDHIVKANKFIKDVLMYEGSLSSLLLIFFYLGIS